MNRLSLNILGRFFANLNGQPLLKFRTNRVQALLVFLATEQALGTAVHRREGLLDVFWPGLPEKSAYQNLRQTIYELKKMFPGKVDGKETPFLLADRQTVGLNPAYPLDFDVAHFQKLLRGQPPQWAKAVELYRGDFLADFSLPDAATFEHWVHARRTAFRRQMLDTLSSLATHYSDHGFFEQAIPFARRQIALESLHEPAYRQLMIALAHSGRTTEALTLFDDLQTHLHQELGVKPDATSRALFKQIARGELPMGTTGQLRGFDLQEQIGAGSFGAVYRAMQQAVDREVAIKIILPKYANDPDFIRHFEAEAQTIARLEHPHIVPLYDYWREPHNAYLVMRLLRGGSLQQALTDGGWEAEPAVRLVDQITDALHTAHQQHIIHRDIKAGNILLDEGGNAYLSDFGIAHDLHAAALATVDERVLTSLSSVSPEQIRREPLTPATDIYSLGVLLFHLLSGRVPFEGSSPAERLYKHAHELLPSIRERRPDLPPAVDEVIQRATAKAPAERFTSPLVVAEAFRQALTQPGLLLPLPAAPVLEIDNPYKGLQAFAASDARLFFGREEMVARLHDRFQAGERFVAVIGPSGSGKSSLVRAGLVPALRQEKNSPWFTIDMIPGSHPFEELELALQRVAVRTYPSLLPEMKGDERGIVRAVRKVVPDEGSPLLLVIDQFEEIFTLVEDPRLAQQFVRGLQVALADRRSPLRLVITLRADFYDRVLLMPDFSELVRTQTEVVTPMRAEELARTIRRPAALTGVVVEADLVTQMIADVTEQPGSLPLLQYSLAELYRRRQDGALTAELYRAFGGISGAIGRRAEEIFGALKPGEQEAVKQLFLRLVTLGEGVEDTRRRVRQAELTNLDGQEAADISRAIQTFGEERLLSFDRDVLNREPTVEVAHEALLREWPRLRGWLQESREDVRRQRELAAAAGQWAKSGGEESYLLRGSRLATFEAWRETAGVALTSEEKTYLQKSIAARDERQAAEMARRQRELQTAQRLAEEQTQRAEEQTAAAGALRQRAFMLAGALVLAVVLAAAAFGFARSSNSNADLALTREMEALENFNLAATQEAEALASASLALTREAEAEAERAAAVAAQELARTEANTRATAEAVAVQERQTAEEQTSLAVSRELSQAAGNTLDFDPELSMLLAMQALETAYTKEAELALHDALQQSRNLLTYTGHSDDVFDVIFHPQENLVASISTDNTVQIWNAETGQTIWMWELEELVPEYFGFFEFDDVGERFVAVTKRGQDNQVQIYRWNVINGDLEEEKVLPITLPQWTEAQLTPDWKYLIVGLENGTAELWDITAAEKVLTFEGHDEWVWDVEISQDGQQLALGGPDGYISIWDLEASLATGVSQMLTAWQVPGDGALFDVSFDHSGRLVYVSNNSRPLEIWEPLNPTGPQNQQVFSQIDDLYDVDGSGFLAVANEEGPGTQFSKIIVLNPVSGETLFSFSALNHIVVDAAFSPGSQYIATAGRDGAVRIWDASLVRGGDLAAFGHETGVLGLDFSLDGTMLAFGSSRGAGGILDIETMEIIRVFEGNGSVYQAKFHPEGTQVVTVGEDHTVRIWDVATGELLRLWTAHGEGNSGGYFFGIVDVAYDPTGTRITTAGADGVAKVWDTNTGDELISLEGHTAGLHTVDFSPNGRYIATGSDSGDGTARVWDALSGETVHILDQGNRVWGVAFSPDSRLLATSGSGGIVKLWDLETGEEIFTLPSHNATVGSVNFTEDGSQLITSGGDFTRVWDVANGEEIKTIASSSRFKVVMTPDGRFLYGGAGDGKIVAYAIYLEDTMALAQNRLTRTFTTEECRQYLHLDACPDG
ncbi:MAG: protein kinase [Ardenticatenaceae bacterium]|nr:protein kinase [Ardenticatenaceae bacterium]